MANCSIPNSSPASGRISTRSLRRSRKRNSQPRACTSVDRGSAVNLQGRRQAAALQSAFYAQEIRRWTLDVRRWVFSAIRRVKGAWWPSRSSKPPSPRKWRGRFDSYPLRVFFLVILSGSRRRGRSRRIPLRYSKLISPGFLDFARNDKLKEGR
jgi:hypothetical protein